MTDAARFDEAMPQRFDASTALHGLHPRAGSSSGSRVHRERAERRRIGRTLPLFLAGTMAVTANLTGVVTPAEAKPRAPKPKPAVADRGKTVKEAFADAKRAAATAAAALRATIDPPALYTVGEHDTLPDIAARYGLSTASLLALNGLSWSTAIHAGQVLKLTAAGPIAPVAPESAMPAIPDAQRHVVAAGESLGAIAAAYGVDLAWLLSANGFSPSSIIYPGQVITIPAASRPDPPAPPPPPPPAPVAVEEPEPQPVYASTPQEGVVALTDEMAANAAIIIEVGREMGVPDYGIVIALATAAQESTLRNLDWGDLDSVGLFQQRPSQGWGSVAQLTDPYEATRRFFGGPSMPTHGLLDIPGWQDMPLTVAAQAVQRSAYPDAYAKWEASARAWLAELG